MLARPVVIVNVKTYPQATGAGARRLAESAAHVAAETGAGLALAVQAADIRLVADIGVPIFAQHIEPHPPGANTGYDLLEALSDAGAVGTLINHSEHRLTLADIEAAVARCQEATWTSVVCTNNVATSAAAAALGPDYVAVEPPELIGGDVSVTSADPNVVSRSAEAVARIDDNVRLLCGAGVKTGADVAASIELGAVGVLLASGVARSRDPEAVLRELVSKVQVPT
ncbi:MAG: triose-phosphate isomerase [Euryarchaeota archaeon]|nr:triose-phosphate isomerase [Euryarchaeota archaeon]